MSDLAKIAQSFDRAYKRQARAEKWLVARKKKLFGAFDEELTKRSRARRSVIIPEGVNPDQYLKTYFPGWVVVDISTFNDRNYVLEEHPSLMKYTYVDTQTGRVFGRTVAEGSPSLDDERLKVDHPDLWRDITQWPEPLWSLTRELVTARFSLSVQDDVIDGIADEFLTDKGVQRELIDLDRLTIEQWSQIEDYMIPGKVSARLIPPRDVKPEDLEC